MLLLTALILGLLWNNAAILFSPYSLYLLAFMMTISLSSFQLKQLLPIRSSLKSIMIGVFLNYILFGIVLMLLAWIFLPSGSPLFIGFWFIVASPPGVVIVPFSFLHGGDTKFSAIAVVGASLVLLLVLPIVYLFFVPKETPVDMIKPLYVLSISVFVPFVISRFLVKGKVYKLLSDYKGKFIDVSFFLIVYIVIGINQKLIINDFQKLLLPMIILTFFLFGMGFLFEKIIKKINISKTRRIDYTLIFLVKNNPFSAVVSLMLAGKTAAIPSVALSIVLLLYLIYFSSTHK
jgi:bile acid:Na+ symporter, BASS family